ncbi:uncharacterized protein EV422DRAFT_513846 [Fimicolochytrium jonesii]|uniref:uncharacterized protein n=1 Tax=Fimicolochytrium jonesii TaxID=1396493 RepID=UPI0022FE5083|nr:uncharacterized protein EV422DRAFT_513846 [Fimicolochytrium jonesii]KAI8825681.1 hypothetical protein EV422DRAFT_513846 [Fimicolochytrium jonesii]
MESAIHNGSDKDAQEPPTIVRPYSVASEEMETSAASIPPVESTAPLETVPRTAVDKIARVLEQGAPRNPSPVPLSQAPETAADASVKSEFLKRQHVPKVNSFRNVTRAAVVANVIGKSDTSTAAAKKGGTGLTAQQAMTRLTGVIFDNEGEIPAVLRGLAIKTVESMDKARDQVDTYKPIVEHLIYWENLKIALYFNTAIVSTFLLTKLGFGFGTVIIILIFVIAAFRRNQARLRRKIRNELNKHFSVKKVDTDSETVEWMNLFLSRFWLIFEPSLAEGVQTNVNAVLEANKPGFLDDLRLTTFTLGSQAPRVESIRCYPSTSDDILMMDWDLSFSPVDEDSVSKKARQTSELRNSKIELTARVGKGVASIPLPVLVSECEFRGKARIQLKFMTSFPHIKTVEFCLLEKPMIDFIVRPLKGMDLMDTPGLSNFIFDTIYFYTNQILVDPNKITIDLEQLLGSSTEADKPVGVLRIALYEGKGLRNVELAGKSDPYARVMIGGKPVARTKTIDNSLDPVWDETHHIVISKSTLAQVGSNSDELLVECFDFNGISKDKSLGKTAPLRLARWIKLLEDATYKEEVDESPLLEGERDMLLHEWGSPIGDVGTDVWKKLATDNGAKGDIRLQLNYFPVHDLGPEITVVEVPAGILEIAIHQGRELACSKNGHPECSIEQDGMEIFRTPSKKKTNNPIWETRNTIFVTDLDSVKLKFRVWNDGKTLGACEISPRQFIGKEATDDWFGLFGKDASGRLRVTFKFTPVDLEGTGVDRNKVQRRQPTALLRLHVIEAKGLANVEIMGKSDPYTKLNLAGRAFGATHVKNSVLDPKWDEIFYAVCYSNQEMLNLSVWDWNDFKKDRTLGKTEFMVGDLIKNESTPEAGVDSELPGIRTPPNVGMTEEAWAKLEKDGLKVVRTGMTADVWAPLYIQKSAADDYASQQPSKANSPEGSVEQLNADAAPASKKGFPKVMSIEGLANVGRSSGTVKEPRQKGFIHFVVDYFPVVGDKIIHAEREMVLRKQPEPYKPPITEDGEPLDDAILRAHEKQAALDLEKWHEDAVAHQTHHAARVEFVSSTLKELPSGIISVRLQDAQDLRVPVNGYVELLLDDEPVWQSKTKKHTARPSWSESIDKYISNLAKSNLSLALRNQLDSKERSVGDPVVGVWTGDFTELLGRASHWIALHDPQGLPAGRLRLSIGFAPVAVEGDGSEAAGGMGMLHIDVLEAKDVEGVDTSGASDPYCQVYVNENKVHKTKVVKKSLHPVWNETVSVPITSRLRSTLEVRVKDWNNFAKDITLGSVRVQLAKLPPNEVITKEYPLEGARSGHLKLRMFFDPQALEKGKDSHNGTATSLLRGGDTHDASSRLTAEEGSAVKKTSKALFGKLAGTTIGIGKTLDNSVGRVATRSDKHTKGAPSMNVEEIAKLHGIVGAPTVVENEAADPALEGAGGASISPGGLSRTPSLLFSNLEGSMTLTILEASGLKAVDSGGTSDPFVKIMQMHRGKLKTIHKTSVVKKTCDPKFKDERVTIVVPPTQIRLVVKDHNTLQKDVALGEADIELAEWFGNPQAPTTIEKWVPLAVGGTGQVLIRAEFAAGVGTSIKSGHVSRGSISSVASIGRDAPGLGTAGGLNSSRGGSPIGSPPTLRRSISFSSLGLKPRKKAGEGSTFSGLGRQAS